MCRNTCTLLFLPNLSTFISSQKTDHGKQQRLDVFHPKTWRGNFCDGECRHLCFNWWPCYNVYFINISSSRGPGSSSACSAYCASGLKPRASNFSGPPSKVYNIFDTVIGLSYLCCHSALYSLNNPSVIFLAQLHSISEYCRILINPHHRRLYSNTFSSSRVVTTIEADELPRLIFLRKNREREKEEEEREGKLLKANFNFNHQPWQF